MVKNKLMVLTLLLLCLLLCFSGCGAKETHTAEYLCNELVDIVFPSKRTTDLSAKQLQNYFPFENEALLDYKVVISTEDETYDMVAVFKPDGKENANLILSGVNSAVSSAANLIKPLSENQYNKVANRLLYELDGFYILIIADDYKAPTKFLNEIGAKEVK